MLIGHRPVFVLTFLLLGARSGLAKEAEGEGSASSNN